ncbi:hypothetical protein [Methanothermobacter thermautotrophicus]|uniref:hypothetical protein n=1 Tax=Methanothermobacter thermautotrophicus TaxID=145262 RepID=UPI0018668DE6|nr:hypothetical protein [Methanothermobacter thermautotrophicus]
MDSAAQTSTENNEEMQNIKGKGADYSFKIEVFSTLCLGCFLGLIFIFIRDIKKRVLKPGDIGLFIANMLMLLLSIPQTHLIVCSACTS